MQVNLCATSDLAAFACTQLFTKQKSQVCKRGAYYDLSVAIKCHTSYSKRKTTFYIILPA